MHDLGTLNLGQRIDSHTWLFLHLADSAMWGGPKEFKVKRESPRVTSSRSCIRGLASGNFACFSEFIACLVFIILLIYSDQMHGYRPGTCGSSLNSIANVNLIIPLEIFRKCTYFSKKIIN